MELRGRAVVLRPIDADDAARLRDLHAAPEIARWWGKTPDGFPLDDDPDARRFAILVDGDLVGLIQFYEQNDPDYRYASIDVFLDPRLHGRGHGTDALETLVRHLLEARGHHRITIDPAADNAAAIRSYEKAGFRPVGVMRAASRDAEGVWRDVLLMELVVI